MVYGSRSGAEKHLDMPQAVHMVTIVAGGRFWWSGRVREGYEKGMGCMGRVWEGCGKGVLCKSREGVARPGIPGVQTPDVNIIHGRY